jgi:hypothetical protein
MFDPLDSVAERAGWALANGLNDGFDAGGIGSDPRLLIHPEHRFQAVAKKFPAVMPLKNLKHGMLSREMPERGVTRSAEPKADNSPPSSYAQTGYGTSRIVLTEVIQRGFVSSWESFLVSEPIFSPPFFSPSLSCGVVDISHQSTEPSPKHLINYTEDEGSFILRMPSARPTS